MTLTEMEDCKKKGLYYNYDEKFVPSQHCVTQKLYLLNVNAPMEYYEEDFKDAVVEIIEESNQLMEVVPKISCNSIYGFISLKIMKR